MAIHHWPKSERPRERLLERGSSNLSDAELLAIVLRTGSGGESALGLARRTLQHFGGLRNLLNADAKTFCGIHGMGSAKFVQLQAAIELCRRHLRERLDRGNALASPKHTESFLLAQLRDQTREVFCCLFLDNRHRVIKYEELFWGTLNGTSVYPREVVRAALRHNAAAVILAHNHPSGVAEPSQADRSITNKLSEALGLMDIRVLDHLIIGDGNCVSFAKRGLI